MYDRHMADEAEEQARRRRAEERRSRIILVKGRVSDREIDLSPVRGGDAVSLAARISLHAWSMSGGTLTSLVRAELPVRFVPRGSE
jgi:hypothetical protein